MPKMHSWTWPTAALVMLTPAAALSQGLADSFPIKQIVMVVPQAPGGPGDRETRLYAVKMG